MTDQELLTLCAEVAAIQKQSNEAIEKLDRADKAFKEAKRVEIELDSQLKEMHGKLIKALGARF
jgi:pentose-5-phosphate-3-epimerase